MNASKATSVHQGSKAPESRKPKVANQIPCCFLMENPTGKAMDNKIHCHEDAASTGHQEEALGKDGHELAMVRIARVTTTNERPQGRRLFQHFALHFCSGIAGVIG